MPETITYSTSSTDGGSPFWASHRRYDPLGDNTAGFSAMVEDDGDTEWETPCAQVQVNCYVQIDGDHDLYDVNITMTGTCRRQSRETGTNRTTGGLDWRYVDDKGNALERGLLLATNAPEGPDETRPNFTYAMQIANGVNTLVGFASVAGGIQIPPTTSNYYINVHVMGWVSVLCQITNRITRTAYFIPDGAGGSGETLLASARGDLVRLGSVQDAPQARAQLGERMAFMYSGHDAQFEKLVRSHRAAVDAMRLIRRGAPGAGPIRKQAGLHIAPLTPEGKQRLQQQTEVLRQLADAFRKAWAQGNVARCLELLATLEETKIQRWITEVPVIEMPERRQDVPFSVLYEDFSEALRTLDDFLRAMQTEPVDFGARDGCAQRLRRVLQDLEQLRSLRWPDDGVAQRALDELIRQIRISLEMVATVTADTRRRVIIDEANWVEVARAIQRFLEALSSDGWDLRRLFDLLDRIDRTARTLAGRVREPNPDAADRQNIEMDVERLTRYLEQLADFVNAH